MLPNEISLSRTNLFSDDVCSCIAKNSALEETLGDLRGASDCSNSEAARHHMELKQVRHPCQLLLFSCFYLSTNVVVMSIMQRDFKIRELEQTVEKLGDQYARKCEATDR